MAVVSTGIAPMFYITQIATINAYLESLYITLKTNTMNDNRADFPAIYHNVLKHEWNLSVSWLPSVCHLIDWFSACGFVNFPLTFITLFHRYLLHTLLSYVLCVFVQVLLYFIALLYIVISQRFHFTLPCFLSHIVIHFLQRDGRFCAFIFEFYTAQFFVLLYW